MLSPGTLAPDFSLPDEADGTTSLADLTSDGPTLLAFFKTTCGTCKLSFPVWGELLRRHGDAVRFAAIGQDPLDEGRSFLDDHGYGGAVLDDAAGDYAASRAYALPGVPTLYLIGPDGRVEHASTGWDREAANDWDARLAPLSGQAPRPVSTDDDGLPPFKPG